MIGSHRQCNPVFTDFLKERKADCMSVRKLGHWWRGCANECPEGYFLVRHSLSLGTLTLIAHLSEGKDTGHEVHFGTCFFRYFPVISVRLLDMVFE